MLVLSDGPQSVGVSHAPHPRTETDPVSETLYSLEYRTMDKVQKPSNPECSSCSWLVILKYFLMRRGGVPVRISAGTLTVLSEDIQGVRKVFNQWECHLFFTLYALYVHPDTTHFSADLPCLCGFCSTYWVRQ
jgi:hypothetical protein